MLTRLLGTQGLKARRDEAIRLVQLGIPVVGVTPSGSLGPVSEKLGRAFTLQEATSHFGDLFVEDGVVAFAPVGWRREWQPVAIKDAQGMSEWLSRHGSDIEMLPTFGEPYIGIIRMPFYNGGNRFFLLEGRAVAQLAQKQGPLILPQVDCPDPEDWIVAPQVPTAVVTGIPFYDPVLNYGLAKKTGRGGPKSGRSSSL